MSQSCALIGPSGSSLKLLSKILVDARLQDHVTVNESQEFQIADLDLGWYVSIHEYADSDNAAAVEAYAEDDSLSLDFRDQVTTSRIFDIGFNCFERARSVLTILLEGVTSQSGWWFDDDMGRVHSATTLLSRLEVDPDFDWRER